MHASTASPHGVLDLSGPGLTAPRGAEKGLARNPAQKRFRATAGSVVPRPAGPRIPGGASRLGNAPAGGSRAGGTVGRPADDPTGLETLTALRAVRSPNRRVRGGSPRTGVSDVPTCLCHCCLPTTVASQVALPGPRPRPPNPQHTSPASSDAP